MHKKIITLLVSFAAAAAAFAVNTTYYVNNLSGGGGNNANAGTSAAAPWLDFTPLNTLGTLGPGDQVLLARGATWNQQLTLTGQGTSTNWITIDAYGSGARPKILRNSNEADRCIRINNPSYWRFRNLEIGNAGVGLLIYYTTLSNNGLLFENIYIHDVKGIYHNNTASAKADAIWNSGGIDITGKLPTYDSATQYALRDVTMKSIEGTHNQASISFDWQGGQTVGSFLSQHKLVQNVVIRDLYLHDDDAVTGTGQGDEEGFRLGSASNVVVMDSRFLGEASTYNSVGTAAIFVARCEDVVFVNNHIAEVPNTASNDQCGVDLERVVNRIRFRNNYIADNAGPGIEFLAIHGPTEFSTNHEVAGNAFRGNGFAMRGNFKGSVYQGGNDVVVSATLRDNLSADTPFFFGNGTNITQTNNLAVLASNLSAAAPGFSATQGASNWSYARRVGTVWSNLGYYDAATLHWQLSSTVAYPWVSPFGQHPETTAANAVARVWTAPKAGTVSIRGRVLKADTTGGDGVVAQITKNGTRIWPTAGPQSIAFADRVGFEQIVDNVAVLTGDLIRFEVSSGAAGNNSYDATSWAPAIAYTGTGAEVIVDNTAAEFTGTWTASTNFPNFYGTDYTSHATGTGTNKMRWRPNLSVAGSYSVYYRLPDGHSTRATNAPFTVFYNGGSLTYSVNEQTTPGGSWILLGTHTFAAGTTGYVELTDNANNSFVIGDAIRFLPQ